MSTSDNLLYYGDNLDVLRRHVDDESVDLIYLDPPFNSNADYNVLFAEKDGTKAHAQVQAFEDTWEWDLEAAKEYGEVLRHGGGGVSPPPSRSCMIFWAVATCSPNSR
jgi:DNA modification methylase